MPWGDLFVVVPSVLLQKLSKLFNAFDKKMVVHDHLFPRSSYFISRQEEQQMLTIVSKAAQKLAGHACPLLPFSCYVIFIVYFILASLYATVTPIFEKPDENWHFAFSMYLIESGQLPVQRVKGREHRARQEGSQPPLYYALLAGLLKTVGLQQLGEGFVTLTEKNPYYGYDVRAGAWLDNANPFVHGPCVGACWRTASAVYLGRGLSILSGLLTLVAASVALSLAFPKRPALLLGVVGAMAFNPQFLHISSSVSNDILTVAWVNVAFALGLWWLRDQSMWRVLALGVVVALATLSKLSGLSVVVTMGLWLLFGGALPWRLRWRQLLLYGACFAAVSGWWFVRNLQLYGEPTAIPIHLEVIGAEPTPLTWNKFVTEWRSVINSFWASFGWGGIGPSYEAYVAAQMVILLLALLFVISVWQQWHRWTHGQRLLVGFCAFQLLLVGVLLFGWMQIAVAPLGRLLFPALLPISLILVLGLFRLLPRRMERPAIALLLSGWAAIALFFLVTLIRPAYSPPPALTTLPEGSQAVQVQFGDQDASKIILEGIDAPEGPLTPGQLVPITLYWRALRPIDEQFSIAIKLFGRDEQLLAENNSYPDGGRAPTRNWPPHPEGAQELITDRTRLFLSHETQTPTLARLEIGVFRLDAKQRSWLRATIDGQPVRPMRPISFVVREAAHAPTAPASFRFRPVSEQIIVQDNTVQADITWEVGQPLDGDYQAFFHLSTALDQPPLKSADFTPLGGDFPSSYWQPGDQLSDHAELTLPTDPPQGTYLLLLGLYDLTTQQRITGDGEQNVWVIGQLRWDGETWTLNSVISNQ